MDINNGAEADAAAAADADSPNTAARKKSVTFAPGAVSTAAKDVNIEMVATTDGGGEDALGRSENFRKMSHFKPGPGHRRHDEDADTGIDPHAMNVAVEATTSRRRTRLQLQRALSKTDFDVHTGGWCDGLMNKLVNWATCDKQPIIQRVASMKEPVKVSRHT